MDVCKDVKNKSMALTAEQIAQIERIEWNPLVEGMIWEEHPGMQMYPLFREVPEDVIEFNLQELDKILKFMVLFVDPLSPFYEVRNFEIRKNNCVDALGFKKRSRFLQEVDHVTPYWNSLLFEYFQIVNEYSYESWFSLKSNFHRMTAALRGGNLSATERRHFMSSMKDARKQLEEMEYDLFQDERIKASIETESEKARLGGYAEQYAQILKF